MIHITYKTYSKVLDKTFTDEKTVKNMGDWNLYNLALFHGQAIILETKKIAV